MVGVWCWLTVTHSIDLRRWRRSANISLTSRWEEEERNLWRTRTPWRVTRATRCNECVTAISIRVLWRNSRVITTFFFSLSDSALCFRPVETRVQTPSGAEALGFSAANCYTRTSKLRSVHSGTSAEARCRRPLACCIPPLPWRTCDSRRCSWPSQLCTLRCRPRPSFLLCLLTPLSRSWGTTR